MKIKLLIILVILILIPSFKTVCVSCSHIAFGSIRMEPVFMILGQSAADIASLAIDKNKTIYDLSYDEIKSKLEAAGQILHNPVQNNN